MDNHDISSSQIFEFRRQPAIIKKISEINEKDIRVRISGIVLDSSNGMLIVDDGTGRAEIVSETAANEGAFVRAFTRIIPLEGRYELRAEIVQDLSDVDRKLYKSIYS